MHRVVFRKRILAVSYIIWHVRLKNTVNIIMFKAWMRKGKGPIRIYDWELEDFEEV